MMKINNKITHDNDYYMLEWTKLNSLMHVHRRHTGAPLIPKHYTFSQSRAYNVTHKITRYISQFTYRTHHTPYPRGTHFIHKSHTSEPPTINSNLIPIIVAPSHTSMIHVKDKCISFIHLDRTYQTSYRRIQAPVGRF